MKDTEIELILLAAASSEHGVCVTTTDPELLKRKLYVVRDAARKRGISEYDDLSFRTSPRDKVTELWIVKNAKERIS